LRRGRGHGGGGWAHDDGAGSARRHVPPHPLRHRARDGGRHRGGRRGPRRAGRDTAGGEPAPARRPCRQAHVAPAEKRPLSRPARTDTGGLAFRPAHRDPRRRPVTTLLTDHLRAMAATFPDEVAYQVTDGGHMTFAQWEAESNLLARALVA